MPYNLPHNRLNGEAIPEPNGQPEDDPERPWQKPQPNQRCARFYSGTHSYAPTFREIVPYLRSSEDRLWLFCSLHVIEVIGPAVEELLEDLLVDEATHVKADGRNLLSVRFRTHAEVEQEKQTEQVAEQVAINALNAVNVDDDPDPAEAPAGEGIGGNAPEEPEGADPV
jgi:hypothetical protein